MPIIIKMPDRFHGKLGLANSLRAEEREIHVIDPKTGLRINDTSLERISNVVFDRIQFVTGPVIGGKPLVDKPQGSVLGYEFKEIDVGNYNSIVNNSLKTADVCTKNWLGIKKNLKF